MPVDDRAPEDAERSLPHDPDIEADEDAGGRALPVHLTPRLVFLVFAGGALGVLLRASLCDHVAVGALFPITTFVINVVGAFALAVLLEVLTTRGADVGRRRALRLLVGTGVLGGFTTYSALAVQTDQLLVHGHAVLALAYGVGTVVAGFVASLAGIVVMRRVAGR